MSPPAQVAGVCSRPTQTLFQTLPTKFKPQFDRKSVYFSHRFLSPKPLCQSIFRFRTRRALVFSRGIGGFCMTGRGGRSTFDALRAENYVDDGESSDVHIVGEQLELLRDGSSQILPNPLARSSGFVPTLNRLSKWLVAAIFGVVILWRHDAEALWVATGSILNVSLSVVLKRILNQQRPNNVWKSDPGMPSSHAQSIFYTAIFIMCSIVEWLGMNGYTISFSIIGLAFASFLSWLRIALRFHTVGQVVVGAIVGSGFAFLWLWSWKQFVLQAFDSLLWVRVSVLFGSSVCCLGFLFHIIRNWLRDDE